MEAKFFFWEIYLARWVFYVIFTQEELHKIKNKIKIRTCDRIIAWLSVKWASKNAVTKLKCDCDEIKILLHAVLTRWGTDNTCWCMLMSWNKQKSLYWINTTKLQDFESASWLNTQAGRGDATYIPASLARQQEAYVQKYLERVPESIFEYFVCLIVWVWAEIS